MSSSSSSKEFAHLQIPLETILSATNHFSYANLIKQDRFAKEYKGQLSLSNESFDIVARRLDDNQLQGQGQFWREVSMLSSLKHKNLVSMLGCCDENGEKIVIIKHETRGFLDNYLRDPILTWIQRLQICVNVAHAVSFIYDDDSSVIHCDIRSSKILLDDNWEAKLSGFELSVTAGGKNDLCLTNVCGTHGYRDPIYNKSGSVTHKSDIYSLGIMLFELLCGKKAVMVVDGENRLLAPLAQSHYERGTLSAIIDPVLKKKIDPQSFHIFSEIAYSCVKEQRSDRPNIDQVVMELEKALGYQREHENQLISKASSMVERTTWKSLIKEKSLEHLEIQLTDIEEATENFAKTYVIGRGSFGEVYKAELDHFDSKSLLPLEEKNMGQLHMKRSHVAIKRIMIREDQQGEEGFLAEIETLTSCRHPNIVSLLGFCKENSDMILVYEYASKGSLGSYIGSATKNLTWVQRIKICIEIAHGLNYLHTKREHKRKIIHRDIKSDNILLNENLEAKIADFGLSKFRPHNQQMSTINTESWAGTKFYMDPEYFENGRLSYKIDIYSFGVILFEMLSGRLAYDQIYINENSNGIVPVARRRFNDRTIKEMVDPRLWEETHENSFSLTKGPNPYALHAFIEIAHRCVAETQPERPTAEVIIKKLEEVLSFQEGNLKHLEIPLIDIELATANFAKTYLTGSDAYGEVYKAELDHFDSKKFLSFEKKNIDELPKKRSIVTIKRILSRKDEFKLEKVLHAEVEMVTSCNHPNILSLLGFCEESGHMILVYEHASNGSLDAYLGSTTNLTNLTWAQRVKICIDIARGLNYLHPKIKDKRRLIHCDIKSGNIVLGENWVAMIADFGLPEFHVVDAQLNALAETQVYLDPEYERMHMLTNETDIYSFGVVLFEILFGRLANDPVYTEEHSKGIVPTARQRFNDDTIKAMVDPKLIEEAHENIGTPSARPNKDSVAAFSKIAYQCVEETQSERPTAETIVNKLEEALHFQENIKDSLIFSLESIRKATQNFNDNNLIGSGGYSRVYKGEITGDNGCKVVAVKRLEPATRVEDKSQFFKELQCLLEYKHENIIGIVGYCFENGESIIVYEYASRRSLDDHVKDNGITWMKRLQICIDIASGLDFLHGGLGEQVLIHRDVKPANILLNDDWRAKISDFGLSLITPNNEDLVIDMIAGTQGYIDPQYMNTGVLTKASDIYTFGVLLFEMLSGRLNYESIDDGFKFLTDYVEHLYKEGKIDEIVFEDIKDQIAPKSLTTFLTIAYKCLHYSYGKRPTAVEVKLRLKEAMECQNDHDIWGLKLPDDYKEIIEMSDIREIYNTEKMKDIYDRFCKGILLREGKVLFSVGGNGERNEMISARKFSYKHRQSHKWRSVLESRFHKVAKMLDISNLKIQVKIKPQFISLGVNYGVHLVFRFCGPRKSVAKRMYVNLKYKRGSETLNAYFATRRQDGWMTIELCRFLNLKEDAKFEFLLESFSRCYCRSDAVYIEGIEFRAIDNVKYEESKNLKEVQQDPKLDLKMEQVQQLETNFEKLVWRFEKHGESEELFSLNKDKKKKPYMLLAKEVLYESSDVKLLNSKPSAKSRFEDVIELSQQQVFRINCKIGTQRLSPDTAYARYLVFKLSEKCRGLHCPVIVRDLLHRKNKEKGIIYFRFPSPCNVDDATRIPEEREDGWVEVNIWKFNSSYEIRNGFISMSLKLSSYEGTMSGLIVSGIEFQPV